MQEDNARKRRVVIVFIVYMVLEVLCLVTLIVFGRDIENQMAMNGNSCVE